MVTVTEEDIRNVYFFTCDKIEAVVLNEFGPYAFRRCPQEARRC